MSEDDPLSVMLTELTFIAGDHHWEVKTPPVEALNGFEELHGCDPHTLTSIRTRTSFGSREQQELTTVSKADILDRAKRLVIQTYPSDVQS